MLHRLLLLVLPAVSGLAPTRVNAQQAANAAALLEQCSGTRVALRIILERQGQLISTSFYFP